MSINNTSAKIIIIIALTFTVTSASAVLPIISQVKRPTRSDHRVGIALSGGGALGFAHIGALQALNEHGIYPDCIAGTSMGSIIGVMYAAGYTPLEILEIVRTDKLYKMKRLLTLQSAISTLGMSRHDALHSILLKYIPHNSFDSLQIPFTVCVTNFDSVRAEYRSGGGQLSEYVVASSSIPGVFEALNINGTTYVDGGVMDNLPSRSLKHYGCQYIIGVDVLPVVQNARKTNAIDIAVTSLRTMQHINSLPGIEACNWLIDSYALTSYHELSFEQYREIYQIGYQATIEYLRTHPDLINSTTILM